MNELPFPPFSPGAREFVQPFEWNDGKPGQLRASLMPLDLLIGYASDFEGNEDAPPMNLDPRHVDAFIALLEKVQHARDEGDRDALAKEHVTASETESPSKETIMNDSTPTAPEGFTLAMNVEGVHEYDGPVHKCDGFKVITVWSPEEGHGYFIDHDGDNAFTLDEIDVLAELLRDLRAEHGEDK